MTMPLDFDKTKNFTSVEIQTFTITIIYRIFFNSEGGFLPFDKKVF